MRKGIEANFKGFTAIDDAGRLIGPWNPGCSQRSDDLTREEGASALVSGRVLQPLTYQQAVTLFGEEATAEFIYLVGL